MESTTKTTARKRAPKRAAKTEPVIEKEAILVEDMTIDALKESITNLLSANNEQLMTSVGKMLTGHDEALDKLTELAGTNTTAITGLQAIWQEMDSVQREIQTRLAQMDARTISALQELHDRVEIIEDIKTAPNMVEPVEQENIVKETINEIEEPIKGRLANTRNNFKKLGRTIKPGKPEGGWAKGVKHAAIGAVVQDIAIVGTARMVPEFGDGVAAVITGLPQNTTL